MKYFKEIKTKGVYHLLILMLLSNSLILKAQTLDSNSFSNYIGYENSIKNGFLSQFSSNGPNKSDGKLENSFALDNVDYDYHGIVGNSMNIPRAQCADPQGNIYITGTSGNIENNSGDITTIKVNSLGEIVWTLRIPSTEFTVNSGTKITIGIDGSIYLVGYLWNQTSMDIISAKISNDGQVIWQTTIGSLDNFEVPTALTVNEFGEMYIAGLTLNDAKVTYYIAKIGSGGELIWEYIENDFPNQTWNEPRIIHQDGNGDIIVCGIGYDEDLKSKTITAKFNYNGEQIWKKVKTFEATVNDESIITDGWPTDFAIDANDNIYVTNNFSSEFVYASMTLKYDSNGNELWNQIHQLAEVNTRTEQIFFHENLLFIGGYHYGDSNDGFITIVLNLDGSLNWNHISSDQYSPQKFSMSVNENKIYLNSVSFDPADFGSVINSASYAFDSGTLIDSASLNLNTAELGFSLNDFFHVINSSDSKSIVLSTYYPQYGNVYEVLKVNNLDNSAIWNTKFVLDNSSRTTLFKSVGDSNSNVFSIVNSFYVSDDNILIFQDYLVKHDADGNFISTDLIDESPSSRAIGIEIDSDDNLVVMIKEDQLTDIKLKKFTNTMQLMWSVTFPLNSRQYELMGIDDENNIHVVTAAEALMSPFETIINATKISPTGDIIYSNLFQSENESLINNFAAKLLFDETDNLIIGGFSSTAGSSSNIPTLINISPNGSINYFKDFQIQNNSSALVDFKSLNNDFYLAIGSTDNQNGLSGIHLIKVNSLGEVIWQNEYFAQDRDLYLYKLLYSSSNNSFYTVNFNSFFSGGNIEVVAWNLDGDIESSYTLNENVFYQDAFSDSQYIYVLTQNQEDLSFPRRLLNWFGPFISSQLTKLNFDLTLAESIDFVGTNYSLFEPKQLIPLNNSNLLVSGKMFHEELFFEGLKFFATPYEPTLSIPTFPEEDKSIFYAFPNPTSNYAYIIPKEEVKEITVFDMLGNKVILPSTSHIIDVSKLTQGIYLVKVIKNDNKVYTTKLIKK